MDPKAVRDRAQAFCEALVDGDMTRAATALSHELQSNLGSLVAILPLPLTDALVESVEVGGSGYVARVRLIGETSEIELQTRWKERDGRPTIVEASHVVVPIVEEAAAEDGTEE
jgi:hypothetical protein